MNFLASLGKYLIMMSPFLLLGLFMAGIIHVFLNVDKVKKFINHGTIGDIFKAALFGIPLPLCSCAVIPSAVTLRKAGVKNGPTSSFLISTPETGIDSIMVTYGLMDLPMTIFRPVAAFISATIAGILQRWFNDFEYIDDSSEKKSCCKKKHAQKSGEANKRNRIKEIFRFGYFELLEDIISWLSVGILIGAGIDYFIPVDMFTDFNGTAAKLIILFAGIPMYVCASATTPIAAALVLKGLSPGAALLFLLVGPATNISNILVLQKYIGRKGVFINILTIALVSLGLSYAVDYFYSSQNISTIFKAANHHDHGSADYTGIISAVIFSILMLKALYNVHIKKYFQKI
jgi:uncharacterized protein